jgi:hypothetical protein
MAAFERIFASSPQEVEVDLADLDFLDSTAYASC